MIQPAKPECMISPRAADDTAQPDWQSELRGAIRDAGALAEAVDTPIAQSAALAAAVEQFSLLAPRTFLSKIRRGDPRDPLLLQILPQADESTATEGFSPDPLGERQLANRGVLRKYAGRALFIASEACPIHCRYCFRRAFPYAEQSAARNDWRAALAELEASPEISEVILSGGDPLTLSNRRIAALLRALDAIPSIDTLRIHTRFPVVLPGRIDRPLLESLGETRLKTVIVLHCNHASELCRDTEAALKRLSTCTDLLLNQSVLLRGINDDAATLIGLSKRLFDCGVLPYYLHMLDKVAGAAHFETSEAKARAIAAELRAALPGYLVPKLVREIPGEASKTPL